jgi:PAS domain S-box-containing protein
MFSYLTSNAQLEKLNLDSLWTIIRSENSADTSKVHSLSKVASQYFNTYPDSTIFFLKQSIDLSSSIDYKKGEAQGYMNLGAIASIRGDYGKGTEYSIKALEIIEETSDTLYRIQILTNIASLMQSVNQIERGVEYTKQALELADKFKDVGSQVNSLTALAAFKVQDENYKAAILDYKKSLRLIKKHNLYLNDYYYTLAGLADCYEELYGNYDSTFQWYNKITPELRKKLNYSDIEIAYFFDYSRALLKYKRVEQAELYADSAFVIAKRINATNNIAQYYLLKSKINQEMGLYKAALENYKLSVDFRDSIRDKQKEVDMIALEMKYNSEKKGKELILKKAELEKNNIEIQSQKNQKFIMMIVFGLGTIFTWFVIFSFLKNRKKNTLLKSQNEELEKLSIVAKEIDSTVIITDRSGTIEWINEGMIDMYELTLKDLEERIGANIIETSNYKGLERTLEECISTKKSSFYTSKHFKKSGSVLWVQTTLTPILDHEGTVNKIVFIDTNVSAVKKSEVKLTEQKSLLQAKNSQITDSFNYAKRIQQAVLPSDQTLSAVWEEYFALLNPKDIVSGDFYWFYEKNDKKYLAVVDCTGHGVPGAFMTIIGNNLLNEILQDDFDTPEEILQELHNRIKLRLGGSIKAKVMDSMDLGLVRFDTTSNKILFCGTHTSIYLVRGRSLTEFKGSKETIGFKDTIKLNMHTLEGQSGDMIYMHTDGYPDQKGGKKNKKFYYQPIRDMLINISRKSVEEQKDIVEQTFQDWKGKTEQTDDVCMVGVRIR